MEFLTTLKGLLVVVLTIVPGISYMRVRRRFAVVDEPKEVNHAVVMWFTYSLIMVALSWVLLAWAGLDPSSLLKAKSANELALALLGSPVTWGLTIFVIPACAGFVSAVSIRYNLVSLPFRLIGVLAQRISKGTWDLHRLQPLPSFVEAWAAAWLKLNSGTRRIVIVGLEDGTTITGLYDGRAATSRSDRYPDVFLAQLGTADESGTIKLQPASDGVFIRGSRIVWMQLWKLPEVGHGTQNSVENPQNGGARHD